MSLVNYYFQKANLILTNNLFFILILGYLLGPAVSNILLTLISILSLIFYKKTFNHFKDITLFITIFFLYVVLKELFKEGVNFDLLSFIRFFLLFLFINHFYKNDQSFLNKPIYILFILVILDTIFQYFVGHNILGFPKYDAIRLTSFFGDEPIVGSFLSKLFFPILVFFIIKKKNHFLFFFVLTITPVTILLTGERMPLLLCIMGLVLVYLLFYRNIKFLLIFFISIIISAFILNDHIKERYVETFESIVITKRVDEDLTSVDIYKKNFQSAYNVWQSDILFGSGYRGYRKNCKNFVANDSASCSTHPHNIYLELLSDHGIFGLILFTIFITKSILISNKSNIFLVTFIMIIFPFATSQSIYSSYYGYLFFTVLSFLIASSNNYKKN